MGVRAPFSGRCTRVRCPVRAPTNGFRPVRISDIKAALEAERDHCKTGIAFRVSAIRREGATVVVAVDTIKGRRSTAIDETLEGSRVVWGDNFEGHGKVFVVSPDTGELILDYAYGPIARRRPSYPPVPT